MTRLIAYLQGVLLELLRQLELRFLVLSRPPARACSRDHQLMAVLGAAAVQHRVGRCHISKHGRATSSKCEPRIASSSIRLVTACRVPEAHSYRVTQAECRQRPQL